MNPSHFEFHNCSGPEKAEFGDGWRLPRYPFSVRKSLNPTAQLTSRAATGVEIRFVTDAARARVHLACPEDGTEAVIFRGNFQVSSHGLDVGTTHCLHLSPPERFTWVRPEALRESGYSPNVWRVIFSGGTPSFLGVDAMGHEIRPPLATEKPRLKWLAYGSSITHASWNGYPQQAARRLNVEVQNKGLSGSCHIEPEAADFLTEGCDWDFITLELGINMRGQYSREEFEKRARYLVQKCRQAKPGRPVILITVFPNFAEWRHSPENDTQMDLAYNDVLRALAAEFSDVHLIEGSAMLPRFDLLSADLVHPTDTGHARMAEVLAAFLEPIIAKL